MRLAFQPLPNIWRQLLIAKRKQEVPNKIIAAPAIERIVAPYPKSNDALTPIEDRAESRKPHAFPILHAGCVENSSVRSPLIGICFLKPLLHCRLAEVRDPLCYVIVPFIGSEKSPKIEE